MCDLWDISCKAGEAASAAVGPMLAATVKEAITTMVVESVAWWVHLPSPDVTNPATVLRQWMLPFTALVATGGILWQALLMIVTRKGEPLANVVKGVFATALWGGIAVIGTNALVGFADSYSTWLLLQGLDGNVDALADRIGHLLIPGVVPPGLIIIIGAVEMIAAVVQAVLLLFRNAAIIILTGLLQLAAAGSFTSGTANWLRKILTWHLALILYKPMAATIYAVGFMLVGDDDNQSLTVWLSGVGMLGLSIVALPAMLRFFNWTVGAVQTQGGGLGMLAAAGAAGVHGAASMRGVLDHARDMDRRYGGPPPPSAPPGGSGAGRGAPTSPPSYTGPAPAAASSATTTSATATTTTAGATTAAGAAASGPAAPIVAGTVAAGAATVGTVKAAANTATRGTDGGTS